MPNLPDRLRSRLTLPEVRTVKDLIPHLQQFMERHQNGSLLVQGLRPQLYTALPAAVAPTAGQPSVLLIDTGSGPKWHIFNGSVWAPM